MWTSDRRRDHQRSWAMETGEVTIPGDPAGVYLSGERRQLAVYAPGGYVWRPALGQRVLVLKAGSEQEEGCLTAARQDPEQDLQPGEVRVFSQGGARITLDRQGQVLLEGELFLNGLSFREAVEKIVRESGGGM